MPRALRTSGPDPGGQGQASAWLARAVQTSRTPHGDSPVSILRAPEAGDPKAAAAGLALCSLSRAVLSLGGRAPRPSTTTPHTRPVTSQHQHSTGSHMCVWGAQSFRRWHLGRGSRAMGGTSSVTGGGPCRRPSAGTATGDRRSFSVRIDRPQEDHGTGAGGHCLPAPERADRESLPSLSPPAGETAPAGEVVKTDADGCGASVQPTPSACRAGSRETRGLEGSGHGPQYSPFSG